MRLRTRNQLWIADIVRSGKKIRSINLVEELDALCAVLENAEHNHARVRGVHVEQCHRDPAFADMRSRTGTQNIPKVVRVPATLLRLIPQNAYVIQIVSLRFLVPGDQRGTSCE